MKPSTLHFKLSTRKLFFNYFYVQNLVALAYGINHINVFYYFAKYRMVTVKVGSIITAMANEEL